MHLVILNIEISCDKRNTILKGGKGKYPKVFSCVNGQGRWRRRLNKEIMDISQQRVLMLQKLK
jgi:hypothetical protein